MEAIEQDIIQAALRQRLSCFEFEEGAVLIQIPQVPARLLEKEVALNRGYFAYPPQGLMYIAAVLRSLGIKTTIIDLNLEVLKEAQEPDPDIESGWKKAVDESLALFTKPLICVSFMFESTYAYFRQVCRYIREQKPGACIICGGVNATADAGNILKEGLADFVFSHEAEGPLRDFYAFLRQETPGLPLNLNFTSTSGELLNTSQKTGGNVDEDIRQEYALIPIREYYKVGSLGNYSRMAGLDTPFATVIAKRGCRGRCSFCSVRGFYGQGVRIRSAESVVQEMELLHKQYGIRHFDWLDDDLLYDPQETLKMFELIAERLPGITWSSNNGLVVIAINRQILKSMQKSGCIGFKVGLESGNEEILRRSHKILSLESFFSFAKMAQDFPSMFIAVNVILGLPGETFGQMCDSFKVALKARLDWYNLYFYQPVRNSELYSEHANASVKDNSLEAGSASDGPGFNPVRGGFFKGYRASSEVASGYDVIDIDPRAVPDRGQLKEIWFTFNHIINFLRMPALFADSEERIKNGIRWLEALAGAYPDNPAISCVIYYLKKRLSLEPRGSLNQEKDKALKKFKHSEYWQARDRQFNFSAFLDGGVPKVDERYV